MRANNELSKRQELISKAVSSVLCLLIFCIALGALASPLVTVSRNSITPFDLIFSPYHGAMEMTGIPTLIVSFYVYKVFYILMALALAILFIFFVFFLVSNKRRFSVYCNYITATVGLFLFVNMLIGFNYVNAYAVISRAMLIETSAIGFFVVGFLIMVAKFGTSMVLDRRAIDEDAKGSTVSISMAFVLLALILGMLVTPLYSFSGTRNRTRGIDIILGNDSAMGFLRMTDAFRAFVVIAILIGILSFVVNLVFFLKNRKLFLRYNKINTFVGISILIFYALMGFNYMIVYFDYLVVAPSHYVTIFSHSMMTFAYLPLAAFVILQLGIALAKISSDKVRVEYKVVGAGAGAGVGSGIMPTSTNDSEETGFDPIPAFSELDWSVNKFEAEYKRRMGNRFEALTLPKLVEHIIEYAKHSTERLSYSTIDIKTFVAGIAASKLSILQGMSGTGKTSLPKIFMEAIDGYCELVAVESSWRDKNELLGYYNEFSKKFTPKGFAQFLYKAALNRDTPFFIVLDELNLSRIEYYFSDFLSLMESHEHERKLKLFDLQLYPSIDNRREYFALRDGHTIDIPTNVWFVGTANRDESTFEISDKVYDRAQTMNFEKRAPKIKSPKALVGKKFVPYTALRQLFDEAMTFDFDAESYDTISKVEKLLRPYRISFGNRILKQMEQFVKVYTACSDTGADRSRYIHEAVDCIIFSKVVRKLEIKQIMEIDALIEQFGKLKLPRCVEFLQSLVEEV